MCGYSTIFLYVLVITEVGWGLNCDYQYATISTKNKGPEFKTWSERTLAWLGHSRVGQKAFAWQVRGQKVFFFVITTHLAIRAES